MNTYSTSEVAKIIGIHPNTVRMYEEWELIPKAERKANGYRIFTDFHLEQLRLARVALQMEVLQNGLRKKIVEAVKASAKGEFDRALCLTENYRMQLQREIKNAAEAIQIAQRIFAGTAFVKPVCMRRREVSEYLDISMDTLRNWELNGLLRVKRKQNGYRVYTGEDIDRLCHYCYTDRHHHADSGNGRHCNAGARIWLDGSHVFRLSAVGNACIRPTGRFAAVAVAYDRYRHSAALHKLLFYNNVY